MIKLHSTRSLSWAVREQNKFACCLQQGLGFVNVHCSLPYKCEIYSVILPLAICKVSSPVREANFSFWIMKAYLFFWLRTKPYFSTFTFFFFGADQGQWIWAIRLITHLWMRYMKRRVAKKSLSVKKKVSTFVGLFCLKIKDKLHI